MQDELKKSLAILHKEKLELQAKITMLDNQISSLLGLDNTKKRKEKTPTAKEFRTLCT